MFSKVEPINVVKGLPAVESEPSDDDEEGDGAPAPTQKESEGRIITLEFENTFVIATCEPSLPNVALGGQGRLAHFNFLWSLDVPNAGQGLKNLAEKVSRFLSTLPLSRSLDR